MNAESCQSDGQRVMVVMIVSGKFGAGYLYCVPAVSKVNTDEYHKNLREVAYPRKFFHGAATRQCNSDTTTLHLTV